MSTARISVRRIVDLAERIEADIKKRNLQPGDRYLRTPETAKMLGVDSTLANRALQLLVKRNRLQRRPRVGTIIAEATPVVAERSLKLVHLLASDRQRTIEAMFESGELLGLQGALPGVRIQFEVVPATDEDAYMKNVVASALNVRDQVGFVLYGSTLKMQRVIAESSLPAVVRGRLHPSISGMPFVDSDQVAIGTLVGEHLVQRGHRRIVVLMQTRMFPGDMMKYEAIRDVIDQAGLSPRSLSLRCVPGDEEAARAIAEELIAESSEPLGVFAFSRHVADAVIDQFELRGITDATVVTADTLLPGKNAPNYSCVERHMSETEQGKVLGETLMHAVQHGSRSTPSVTIPVKLRVPNKSNQLRGRSN